MGEEDITLAITIPNLQIHLTIHLGSIVTKAIVFLNTTKEAHLQCITLTTTIRNM